MVYYAEVKFLSDVTPALVERNADEFKRIRDLLESVEPSVQQARKLEWKSAAQDFYDARLRDANGLIEALSVGFNSARQALDDYAVELAKAQHLVEEGQYTEQKLGEKVSEVALAVTRSWQDAEPMRRWEDISSTTGIFDWIAEFGMDVDSIREDAERFYEQTKSKFAEAKRIEETARSACLLGLEAAYKTLPDFRANSADAAAIISGVDAIESEAEEAQGDPSIALSGSGPKVDVESFDPTSTESPTLKQFREIASTLPEGVNTPYLGTMDSADWIQRNKATIAAAAKTTGLPTDLIAGIAWKEVPGKGRFWDDFARIARSIASPSGFPVAPRNLPSRLGGELDKVSYGALAIQVERAAEVLGYDPKNLTDDQRSEIISASEDPKTNVLISAKHLADLKAQTEFADVPADQMTAEQYAELGARYNGGPNWNTNHDAQEYGRDMVAHRSEAGNAAK